MHFLVCVWMKTLDILFMKRYGWWLEVKCSVFGSDVSLRCIGRRMYHKRNIQSHRLNVVLLLGKCRWEFLVSPALKIAYLDPRVYALVGGPAWLPLQAWYPNR